MVIITNVTYHDIFVLFLSIWIFYIKCQLESFSTGINYSPAATILMPFSLINTRNSFNLDLSRHLWIKYHKYISTSFALDWYIYILCPPHYSAPETGLEIRVRYGTVVIFKLHCIMDTIALYRMQPLLFLGYHVTLTNNWIHYHLSLGWVLLFRLSWRSKRTF